MSGVAHRLQSSEAIYLLAVIAAKIYSHYSYSYNLTRPLLLPGKVAAWRRDVCIPVSPCVGCEAYSCEGRAYAAVERFRDNWR